MNHARDGNLLHYALVAPNGSAVKPAESSRSDRTGTLISPLMTDFANTPDTGLKPIQLLTALLDRRRLILWFAVVAVSLVVVPTVISVLLGHRTYTSQTLVTASARRNPSSLSGLAAQFGVAVPGADPTQSPAFFVDVLKSPDLLRQAAMMRVQPSGSTDSVMLADHYRIGGAGARSLEATRKRLDDAIAVTSSQRSGIITIEVKDRDPAVAREIATRLVRLLSDVNVGSRRSQATLERQFTEQRSQEAARDLRTAEEEQRDFLSRNRNCCSSPDLTLERERLERAVTMRQTLYTQLMQAYEQARIEEVRDTPALTTIEAPTLPVLPDRTGIVSKSIVALFVGLTLGICVAFASYLVTDLEQRDAPTYAQLRERLDAVKRDVWRPWRLLVVSDASRASAQDQ